MTVVRTNPVRTRAPGALRAASLVAACLVAAPALGAEQDDETSSSTGETNTPVGATEPAAPPASPPADDETIEDGAADPSNDESTNDADDASTDVDESDEKSSKDDGSPSTEPLDPSSQRPPPVLDPHQPIEPARKVDVGAFTGMTLRGSTDSTKVQYGAGVTWGIYAAPIINSWLSIRAYYREETIPVDVARGGLDLEGDLLQTSFAEDNLELRSLGATFEPGIDLMPRVRFSGIVGIAWLRFTADPPHTSGEYSLNSAERSAVELNYRLGARLGYEAIQDWLNVSASCTYAFATAQTGSAYEPVQAFDSDGRRRFLGPLPKLDDPFDLLISVGLLL